jgi:hypothetical protein
MGAGDGMTHHADFIAIERWGSEQPLFTLSFIISLCVWLVVAAGLIGAAVVRRANRSGMSGMFVAFFTIRHIVMVSHIRREAQCAWDQAVPELCVDVERESPENEAWTRCRAIRIDADGQRPRAFATRPSAGRWWCSSPTCSGLQLTPPPGT